MFPIATFVTLYCERMSHSKTVDALKFHCDFVLCTNVSFKNSGRIENPQLLSPVMNKTVCEVP